MRRVQTFHPIESEGVKTVPKLITGSSKRDAEEELDQGSSKRQKTGESSGPAKEPKDKDVVDLSQDKLQQMMIIVPEQGMNVESLQTKYPIIDYEIYSEDTRNCGYDDDIYDLESVETEFPAIDFNDEVSSETLSCEPTISSLNNEIDFRISFDDFDDEDYMNEFPTIVCNDAQTSKLDLLTEPIFNHQHINEFDLNGETSLSECDEEEQNILYFNDLFPFNIIHLDDLNSKKDNDDNEIDIIQSSGGEIGLDIHEGGTQGAGVRMLIEHRDAQGVNLFTSQAWRRLFDIRGLLVHKLILEFFSTFWFGEAVIDLDMPGALQFQLDPQQGDLRDYWIGISSTRDFLGTTPFYTSIRDPILKLCHRLISYSIAKKSQALKKLTVTNLFYLRGMDVDSVNVPYLLASPRPERQPDVAAGTPETIEDAPVNDEGRQAVLAPV
ncbi:hypothetical protein Tco_1329159 [Tanacetum coccineum]